MGLASWRRTAALRGGHGPPAAAQRRPRSVRSPTATWLAAAAGAAALGTSALSPGWAPGLRLVAGAWGLFVLAAGTAGRVTLVAVGRSTLVVRRAFGADAVVTWDQIRRVVPPRTPLGAWRIAGPGRVISLMPSDLLGREWAMTDVVRGAALRFEDRVWTRAAAEVTDR